MTRSSALRSAALGLSALAAAGALPAFAATIPHTPPRAPAPQAANAADAPASALPYLCNKTEVNTRLEKKVCF